MNVFFSFTYSMMNSARQTSTGWTVMAAQIDSHAPRVGDGIFFRSQHDLKLIGDVSLELGRSLNRVHSTTWNYLRFDTHTHTRSLYTHLAANGALESRIYSSQKWTFSGKYCVKFGHFVNF